MSSNKWIQFATPDGTISIVNTDHVAMLTKYKGGRIKIVGADSFVTIYDGSDPAVWSLAEQVTGINTDKPPSEIEEITQRVEALASTVQFQTTILAVLADAVNRLKKQEATT